MIELYPSMCEESRQAAGDRVLILAPVGRDAELISRVLGVQQIAARSCLSFQELLCGLDEGCACVIVTTEALQPEEVDRLEDYLDLQPAWSDLPVVLLGSGAGQEQSDSLIRALGNVTVLERPLSLSSMLSAVSAAIRARRRQYEVRDLIAEMERARREALSQQAQIAALNERLQRAMTETHHRVKNNLQIIAAMVDLQTLDNDDSVPVQEVHRLGRHVRMLAAVHDVLTQQAKTDGQARDVSARAILERLLPIMQQLTNQVRLEYRLDDVRLPARQATSLAIVVNELVSNGVKHGRSCVMLDLRAEGGELTLEILDDGPGFPPNFDPSAAARTGLDLVQSLAAWDLGGRVAYLNRPGGGARVLLSIPLRA